MTADEIAYQALQVSKESSRWAFYSLIAYWVTAFISVVSAVITLFAVVVARKGLNTWKEQYISVAKAEWIASLVNYMSGLSYLPKIINWDVTGDRRHVERVAELQYECVKRYKVLQIHLSQDTKIKEEFEKKYEAEWVNFAMHSHNLYMSGRITREELKEICVRLYNL